MCACAQSSVYVCLYSPTPRPIMRAAIGFGGFITISMWPMVRKSFVERLGIKHSDVNFRADVMYFVALVMLVTVTVLWQHEVETRGVPNN